MRFTENPPIKIQRSEVSKSYQHGDGPKTGRPNAGLLRFLRFTVVLTSVAMVASGEPARDGSRIPKISSSENPEVATELSDVVAAFIAAGEQEDPAARGKYLGPKVFYYGRARTHDQAVKKIAALYRRWPQRKFTLTDSIDLFEILNHQGVYRVTAVYEYKFENRDERLSGKSKLTCVVEHDQQGTRITGIEEQLISGSTVYEGG